MKKVSGFGVDLEFSEETSRQFKSSVEAALKSAQSELDSLLAAEVRTLDLRNRLRVAVTGLGTPDNDFRATLHIEDPLFTNWLYQVVDYVPVGGGKARRFNACAGIIGLAWRLGRDQYAYRAANSTAEDYAKRWGLTIEQAQQRSRSDKGKALAARVIRHDERIVGILYADMSLEVAPPDKRGGEVFPTEFEALLKEVDLGGIATHLDELLKKVRTAGPQIELDKIQQLQ